MVTIALAIERQRVDKRLVAPHDPQRRPGHSTRRPSGPARSDIESRLVGRIGSTRWDGSGERGHQPAVGEASVRVSPRAASPVPRHNKENTVTTPAASFIMWFLPVASLSRITPTTGIWQPTLPWRPTALSPTPPGHRRVVARAICRLTRSRSFLGNTFVVFRNGFAFAPPPAGTWSARRREATRNPSRGNTRRPKRAEKGECRGWARPCWQGLFPRFVLSRFGDPAIRGLTVGGRMSVDFAKRV